MMWREPPSAYFEFVVVERAGLGDDFGHGQRAVAHHADGQFAAGDVFLDHRRGAEAPGARDLGAAVVAAADDSTPTEEPSFTGFTT